MTRAGAHRDYEGAKYGMWFFLLTELLFFGGMFLLYAVFRYRFPDDFHRAAMEENLVTGTINTIILLTSSLAVAVSISALKRGKYALSMTLQGITIVLGIIFLCIKGYEWWEKIARGLYPNSPALLSLPKGEILYFGLYYVMTGIHGIHVLVGIFVMSFMLFFTAGRVVSETDSIKLENAGLYWHFVDMVWIFLFPLFYLVT